MMGLVDGFRTMLTSKADGLRSEWACYVADWEANTEPGYPMTGWDRDRRRFALALADLYDALASKQ